jgi:hypothetical protein
MILLYLSKLSEYYIIFDAYRASGYLALLQYASIADIMRLNGGANRQFRAHNHRAFFCSGNASIDELAA